MNIELFIAKRIVFGGDKNQSISKPIVRIAMFGVALGLCVMIISMAVVTGFQQQIRDKVIGFGGHIQITNYDANNSLEIKPINKNQSFIPALRKMEGVKHIQVFATKAGIIKTKDAIEGVVLKGVGKDFDWNFFKDKIIEGSPITFKKNEKSEEVIISKYMADRLNLKVNEKIRMYFIQEPPRVRAFKISGIYETGLEEFDKMFVIADIGHIQKLNDWHEDEVGGFEVLISNFDDLDQMGKKIYKTVGYNLNARTIKEVYPQIFDWLQLQNINVIIIIVLMIIVAGINMISALLIIILERTNMIGILKALGADNFSIRKTFLYIATYLTGFGMLWGNVLGLSLCLLQKYTHVISLPQESYYVSVVPINFSYLHFLTLNGGTLFICVLMLLLPTMIITKISPVKAIAFS